MDSTFLRADLELHQEPHDDNAAYIATWLEVLKNDNRVIFTAAAHAQRAADYLNHLNGIEFQSLSLSLERCVHRDAQAMHLIP